MNHDIHNYSRRSLLLTTAAAFSGAVATRTGRASPSTQGTVAWYRSGISLASNPVYFDDRIYVADADGSVLCCDAATGDDLWVAAAGSEVEQFGLAVDQGNVVVGTQNGTISAFGAPDGSKLWERSVPGEVASVAIHNGTVVYGLEEEVGALDLVSGGVKWPEQHGFDTYTDLRSGVTDEIAAFAYLHRDIRGVSIASGSVQWTAEPDSWWNKGSTSAIDARDGAIYIGGDGGDLLCLNAEDGSIIWSANTGNSGTMDYVTASDEYVVAANPNPTVFRAATGRKRYTMGVALDGIMGIADGELVVAGNNQSGDRIIQGTEIQSGTTNWKHQIEGSDYYSHSGVAVGPNAAFIVDEKSERLIAVQRKAGETGATQRLSTTPANPTSETTSTRDSRIPEENPTEQTSEPAPSSTNLDPKTPEDGRGFFRPGDNILQEVMTPWGVTLAGFLVSIGGIIYQKYRYQ